jgi:hypothetical protein
MTCMRATLRPPRVHNIGTRSAATSAKTCSSLGVRRVVGVAGPEQSGTLTGDEDNYVSAGVHLSLDMGR